MRLSRSDLEGALGFLAEAGASDEAEPFPSALLSSLATLVRCESVTYVEVDRRLCQTTAVAEFGCTEAEVPEDEEERYWSTLHEHPIRNHRDRTGDLGAYKLYDFVSPRQLRRTRFYAEYLYEVNPGGYLMSVSLPAPPPFTRTFAFVRTHADFGERERTLLNLLQPHMLQHRRAAEVRGRARAHLRVELGLTEREVEVLRHVAEGMRNREIARALWIAPGTVRKHLDHIYAKLEVQNRTAAASQLFSSEDR